MQDDETRTAEALVSLHEQAHGQTPMRTCQQEPCRGLHLNAYGGQQSSLVPAGPARWNAGAF